MTNRSSGIHQWLKRCSAATDTGGAWLALGIVFLTLGIARPSGGFIGLGAVFLALAVARRRKRSPVE
jgi:hypothetical protein